MTSHDPTTLNRQGGDTGTQYRSVIFYHTEEQRTVAEDVISELADYYEDSIVTEVKPLTVFYPGEIEHQNYYNDNSNAGFCTAVIAPKISKLRKMYADRLKN